MDFHGDNDGTLCVTSLKYIEQMLSNYEKVFGELPRPTCTSTMEKGDHPELDTTELFDAKGIVLYQSMISALQWAVTIGHFDINTLVMTLSGFHQHQDEATTIASSSFMAIWQRFVMLPYVFVPMSLIIPTFQTLNMIGPKVFMDSPEPLGNFVTLNHYSDTKLVHDVMTGQSVTVMLHLLNKTPIEWYPKKATVETATYRFEFDAAKTSVEQLIDLHTILRYLGVPIRGIS
jgi:hypothetical protein